MKDEDKTKEQLINELIELRQRIAELEASEPWPYKGGGVLLGRWQERRRYSVS